MKKLYFLDEEERQRILNIHESATKRQYLSEQTVQPVVITTNDKSFDYKFENGKYLFKGKGVMASKYPNWVESKTTKGITAIKALFDKLPKTDSPVVKTAVPPVNTVVGGDASSEVIKKPVEANVPTNKNAQVQGAAVVGGGNSTPTDLNSLIGE
jgi:hypothetical protein